MPPRHLSRKPAGLTQNNMHTGSGEEEFASPVRADIASPPAYLHSKGASRRVLVIVGGADGVELALAGTESRPEMPDLQEFMDKPWTDDQARTCALGPPDPRRRTTYVL